MKVSTRWIKNLNETDGNLLKESLSNNQRILKQLKLILEEEAKSSNNKQIGEDSFTKPAWAEYQAYNNGIQALAKKIIDLLPIEEKKHV